MDFKDYYRTLGVDAAATPEVIKRAYRKLARKYHPDVSKEPDAENRFKEVAEAHEALIDPERRAAYDDLAARHAQARQRGQDFDAAPGRDTGYEFRTGRAARGAPGGAGDEGQDFSAFFESLFGRHPGAGRGTWSSGDGHAGAARHERGADHHARIEITLEDLFRGARHPIALRRPELDADGHAVMRERQLEVNIPKGVRPGQSLRLAGQGDAGSDGAAAGDLYLEIGLRPQARFRLEGDDVAVDLALAPWEAALGATVNVPTPEGEVSLKVPAGSVAGRRLRLKGRGLPGATPAATPGDLYADLRIALPNADTDAARAAYETLARAFAGFDPRAHPKAGPP